MLPAHCRLSCSIGFETVAAYPPRQAWDARSAALSAAEASTRHGPKPISAASECSFPTRVQHRGAHDTSEGEQRHAFCPDECEAAPTSTSPLRCLESAI